MDKPRDHTPVADYLEHSAFTVAAVAADPEVAGLEVALEQKHEELKQSVRAHEDKAEQKTRKRAVFVIADSGCSRGVRACELAIYGLVSKRRDDPIYRRYFKNGLRAVTEAEPRKAKPALVKDMIKAMNEDASKPGIGPIALQFAPQLQAAVAALEAGEKDLSAVESEASYLLDKTIAEIESAWSDEYVKLHGALKMAFPRDPDRVESYFVRFRKDRSSKKSDGEEPVTPPPGAAAGTKPGAGSGTTPGAASGTTPGGASGAAAGGASGTTLGAASGAAAGGASGTAAGGASDATPGAASGTTPGAASGTTPGAASDTTPGAGAAGNP